MKHINESIIGRRGTSYQKYELTNEIFNWDGHTLYHIKALKNIPSKNIKKGEFGGWIESYDNLDQKGDCWVDENAWVISNAKVCGNAWAFGNALIRDNAKLYGNACVYGHADVHGNAEVYGNADVHGNAEICGTAKVDYGANSGKITK